MFWLTVVFLVFLRNSISEATNPPTIYKAADRYELEVGNTLKFSFPSKNDGRILHAHFGSSLYKTDGPFKRCVVGPSDFDLCLQWGPQIINITVVDDNCQVFEAQSPGDDGGEVFMCFPYEEVQWYGGAERWRQDWPVQAVVVDNKPFLTGYDGSQSVAEPFWFSSDGASLHVDPQVPLFIDSNSRYPNELCIISRVAEPYNSRQTNLLSIEICQWGDPVNAQRNATVKYFGKPTGRPADAMFKEPIYSTWVRYGRDINQDKLTDLVSQIRNYSYPVGQIEIDDIWEPCYGASQFDSNRFPNITGFTSRVHELGGRVTAWIYPFINENCNPAYQDSLDNNRYILNKDGKPNMTWWCGNGAAIDFTNATSSAWWVQRTKALMQSSGLDSFKFDAGETVYLPASPKLTADENLIPNAYVRKYVEAVSNFSGYMEVRVGRNTQDLPVFVRMLDKDSRWGLDNGLQSVLTTLFQMNLAGYPFVLPDMIGGNAYGDKITKELFIRWLQASTFMPALQFSMVPWDFDPETVEISRKFLALHDSYSTLLLDAADRAVSDGTPINTPIWWISPQDEEALKCRDEYLLAETILVAPVLEENAVQRDIYLPAGLWLDNQSTRIEGPTWLRNYSAPLDTLPYFVRLPSDM